MCPEEFQVLPLATSGKIVFHMGSPLQGFPEGVPEIPEAFWGEEGASGVSFLEGAEALEPPGFVLPRQFSGAGDELGQVSEACLWGCGEGEEPHVVAVHEADGIGAFLAAVLVQDEIGGFGVQVEDSRVVQVGEEGAAGGVEAFGVFPLGVLGGEEVSGAAVGYQEEIAVVSEEGSAGADLGGESQHTGDAGLAASGVSVSLPEVGFPELLDDHGGSVGEEAPGDSALAVHLEGGLGEKGAKRPLVILTPQLSAYLAQDAEAMSYWGTDEAACSQDEKLTAIVSFMEENDYKQVFANEAFTVYE